MTAKIASRYVVPVASASPLISGLNSYVCPYADNAEHNDWEMVVTKTFDGNYFSFITEELK